MWSPTGLNTPHILMDTHCLYILYFDTVKVGRGEPEMKVRGAIVHKLIPT
jgi:hypothetical protein